jgi:hypothetical protein
MVARDRSAAFLRVLLAPIAYRRAKRRVRSFALGNATSDLGAFDGEHANGGVFRTFSPTRFVLETRTLARLARPTRFERVASTFGGRRSIQLSYGRIARSGLRSDSFVELCGNSAKPANGSIRRAACPVTGPRGRRCAIRRRVSNAIRSLRPYPKAASKRSVSESTGAAV